VLYSCAGDIEAGFNLLHPHQLTATQLPLFHELVPVQLLPTRASLDPLYQGILKDITSTYLKLTGLGAYDTFQLASLRSLECCSVVFVCSCYDPEAVAPVVVRPSPSPKYSDSYSSYTDDTKSDSKKDKTSDKKLASREKTLAKELAKEKEGYY